MYNKLDNYSQICIKRTTLRQPRKWSLKRGDIKEVQFI